MNDAEILKLINEIYSACYPNVASFYHDSIGVELAYITQALITGQKCELHPQSVLVKLLQSAMSPVSLIWNYVFIEPTVICINCEAEVLWTYAAYCPPLSGWLGHECCVGAEDVDNYYEELVYG